MQSSYSSSESKSSEFDTSQTHESHDSLVWSSEASYEEKKANVTTDLEDSQGATPSRGRLSLLKKNTEYSKEKKTVQVKLQKKHDMNDFFTNLRKPSNLKTVMPLSKLEQTFKKQEKNRSAEKKKKVVSFFTTKTYEEPYETKLANFAEKIKDERKARLANRKGREISAEEMRNKLCSMIQLNHNVNFIEHLIESNVNVLHGPVFADGSTLLHIAVRMGNTKIVQCLAA